MAGALHIVPGLDEPGNGISVAARLIASEQNAGICEARTFDESKLVGIDEVWVHSMWTPMVMRSCRVVLKRGKRLVRMTHANLDPLRLEYHGWKKRLAGPIERFYLRRAYRIVATCEAEKEWIGAYLGKRCPRIEVIDLKRFFDLNHGIHGAPGIDKPPSLSSHASCRELHLLYLGRKHPLKGLEYLEAAVADVVSGCRLSAVECPVPQKPSFELRIVSNAFGEEKERVWEWCDVLVLPTLSENFGLVVAEALERGKYVITTDGAPAWGGECGCKMENVKCNIEECGGIHCGILLGYNGHMIYLKGFRNGSRDMRVRLLQEGIAQINCLFHSGKMV